jgi:hypothetical protein
MTATFAQGAVDGDSNYKSKPVCDPIEVPLIAVEEEMCVWGRMAWESIGRNFSGLPWKGTM